MQRLAGGKRDLHDASKEKVMSLVSAKFLLERAMKGCYAVPAFNCANLESLEAVIGCAEEERSGAIVQTHKSMLDPITIESFGGAARALAFKAEVPIAVGLDHGASLAEIVAAVRCGFTTVMMDASDLPLDENIRAVKQVVDICHPQGITVEAALGRMPRGLQQSDDDLARVQDAVQLVKQTGVDALAPAVGNIHGTAHGQAKGVPDLRIALIEELFKATETPLVLHGGSSIPAELIDAAIEGGIRWVIVYSDLGMAFTRALRGRLDSGLKTANPVEYLRPATKALKEVVRAKIRTFHSSGKF
jgi:fructose-bisphosphate aldolase class II